MPSVESGAAWTDGPSPRAVQMQGEVRRLEGELIGMKRRRAGLARVQGNCRDVDAEIARTKQSIGRIRAHLKRGVYG